MANSFGISGAAKQAALAAIVDGKALKGALFLASATRAPTDATYSATGELATSGNYAAGGATVTNANTAGLTTTTAYWTPSASITWTALTSSGSFDALMIYSTTDANRSLGLWNLGAQSVTAGNLTLTMPTNDATTGLIRLA